MVDDRVEEYPEKSQEEYSEEEYPEDPVEEPQEQPQPEEPQEQPKKKSNGLSKAIMTMAILTGGMYVIMFILEYYLDNFAETLNVDAVLVGSLADVGYLFVYAMGAILAILIVIYIITHLRKPTKSL